MDSEKWSNNVINSMVGHRRASIDPSVLTRLESNLFGNEHRHPTLRHFIPWRRIAAAAVMLLAINIYLFQMIESQKTKELARNTHIDKNEISLVSDYKLYE